MQVFRSIPFEIFPQLGENLERLIGERNNRQFLEELDGAKNTLVYVNEFMPWAIVNFVLPAPDDFAYGNDRNKYISDGL